MIYFWMRFRKRGLLVDLSLMLELPGNQATFPVPQ
jgi:hypothetical protein